MKLTNKKKRLISKLKCIVTTITLFMIQNNICFAQSKTTKSIGTAEVETATENIKRVITSIAMPLRRSFNFCKYCCSSN